MAWTQATLLSTTFTARTTSRFKRQAFRHKPSPANLGSAAVQCYLSSHIVRKSCGTVVFTVTRLHVSHVRLLVQLVQLIRQHGDLQSDRCVEETKSQDFDQHIYCCVT